MGTRLLSTSMARNDLERVETKCYNCGQTMEIYQVILNAWPNHFCTDECQMEHREERMDEWNKADYKSPRILREMYWDDEMSQGEIAEELGCSQSAVRDWMGKHGIRTRRLSEAQKLKNRR